MPMNLSVGFTKKLGLPEYGSVGASCSIVVELPSNLIFDDLEAFQRQARQAYAACAQAVDDELARQQQPGTANNGANDSVAQANTRPESSAAASAEDRQNGNGHRNGGGHNASEKQLVYARQIARQIDGLGVRQLEKLASTMFGKSLAALTSLEGSRLIDALKGIKAGEIDLRAALGEEVQ